MCYKVEQNYLIIIIPLIVRINKTAEKKKRKKALKALTIKDLITGKSNTINNVMQ